MIDPRIAITHGARATEDALVERVRELRDAARRDWTLLRLPVRLVVPSASLRNHLAGVLVRRCGVLAGCQVTTLFSVAVELLRAAGHPPPGWGTGNTALFDVLVKRFARLQEPLRERLDDLVDGYAVVSATVRDFLDAGFESVHLEGLAELLETAPDGLVTPEEAERAGALFNVTAATREALDALGLTHRSMLLRQAGDMLESGGPALLPTRELLFHGFAEATGVVTDLLGSLLRVLGGTLYLDRPAPAAYTERLKLRLSQVARVEERADRGSTAVVARDLTLLAAPDPGAELREIGRRIRVLLEQGVDPESIGLVARNLEGRGALVRHHLGRLGIPFSGGGATASPGRVHRDLAVLRDVLHHGSEVTIERWLDALRRPDTGAAEPSTDPRKAFFARGASRLKDLARLDEGQDAAIEALAAVGRRLAEDLEDWAEGSRRFAEHLDAFDDLVDSHLGWSAEDDSRTRDVIDAACEALDVPPELLLTYEEFVHVVVKVLEGRAREPLGGRGGGVQVLGVMEARGLTFDHLFLFAAVRNVLPRPVREDPLLPDSLRRALTRLLPDLPVKATGFDEERHLFAQLLSCAPRITISWHDRDTTGNTTASSPLLESLPEEVERAPGLWQSGGLAWRPIEEELLSAALHGNRAAFAGILPLALEEVGGDTIPVDNLCRGRLAVLEELDPDRSRREGRIRSRRLGPYFGFLGPALDASDPRRGDVSVTALENLAVCPWQTFLRRLLRVAPMTDPLASLPTLRGLLVGQLVHKVLERVGAGPAWPEASDLEGLLSEESTNVLEDHGLGLKGLARAAAEQARPYLETAARLDWPGGRSPDVESVESAESLRLRDRSGDERRVRFRADRVDRKESGLVYTDYKTGAPGRVRQDVSQDLLERLGSGQWLQAAAYVYGARPPRTGRYVFLRPDLEEAARELRLESGHPELQQTFERTVVKLLDVWDRGIFFPRLVEPDEDLEPPRCASCRLAEACLRRDSGARGRLRRWAEAASEGAVKGGRNAAAGAFLDVWWLRPGSKG